MANGPTKNPLKGEILTPKITFLGKEPISGISRTICGVGSLTSQSYGGDCRGSSQGYNGKNLFDENTGEL